MRYHRTVRSMTGYGRGVATQSGTRATVDARSVNHRFLDLKLRGGVAPQIEEAIGARVKAAIERGSVTIAIHLERASGSANRIDPVAAEAAHSALAELARRLAIAGPDLALILAQPGVVVSGERDDEANDNDDAQRAVIAALDLALAQLEDMRAREGAALAVDLGARLDELDQLRARIATLAATMPQQLSKRLHQRVKRLLADEEATAREPSLDPARLAQEIALLADRADVTEELVRLASHLEQARGLIGKPAVVGRRLDFLVQEIGRELNTIGSKSTLAEITTAIVDAKAVLEKAREQIQNVE